jgi:FAD/FMN-containing dehydrogenase
VSRLPSQRLLKIADVPSARWAPSFRITRDASAPDTVPAGFPSWVPLYRQGFENWSGETKVDDLWTCAPTTPAAVVTVVNWAHRAGFTVRPRGHMHGWSPLTVTSDADADTKVVLVDTTQWLTAMGMQPGEPAAVWVQTGATMEELLTFLEANGAGLASVPAVGSVTVGGALAIGGHGGTAPAAGEDVVAGSCLGSMSNALLSCTAVVWSPDDDRYELRTFTRSEPEAAALAVHLGRAFLTEVTLQVTPLQHLRCRSYTDITADTVFAAPDAAGPDSFAAFLDRTGRVESIQFPFTDRPWVKTWEVSPTQPAGSRAVDGPFNYGFSHHLPRALSRLLDAVVAGRGRLTPRFGRVQRAIAVAGLAAERTADLWGPAKNTQLYVKPSTLRLTDGAGVVLTRRGDVQRVVHELHVEYQRRVEAYRARGRYPINGAMQIRVTSVDRADDSLAPGAEAPALSAIHPPADHPEWDTAVWFNLFTLPGTPGASTFYAELEAWAHANYSGYASFRPEWSKSWAFTEAGQHTDREAIERTIPASYGDRWASARATFDRLDPHRVLTNPFLDRLLG